MKDLTPLEIKIAEFIQKDIPLSSRPFLEIANFCGLDEEQVLSIIRSLQKPGYIRRMGAILKHQKAGYVQNALVIWAVPQDKTENTGKVFSVLDAVSHCYERKPSFDGKYNLFTMVHAKKDDLPVTIKKMAAAAGINDYLVLTSLDEYKKKSPEYFNEKN